MGPDKELQTIFSVKISRSQSKMYRDILHLSYILGAMVLFFGGVILIQYLTCKSGLTFMECMAYRG